MGHAIGLAVTQLIANANGTTSALAPSDFSEHQKALALAAYYAAGPAAERLILGKEHSEHGEHDRELINALKSDHPEWVAQIEESVRDAEELIATNRSSIEALAERLLGLPPTVRGGELEGILEKVTQNPPPTHP